MFWRKKNKAEEVDTTTNVTDISGGEIGAGSDLMIQMDELPMTFLPDNSSLHEINDKGILTDILSFLPGLGGAGTVIASLIRSGDNDKLFRVILPAGKKLVKSKEMPNAFRAFVSDGKGITKHANLVPVTDLVAIANMASAAQMIAMQAQLKSIDKKLDEIKKKLDKVSAFQENEYKSKVFHLVLHVKKISTFNREILLNEDRRKEEITVLNDLEQECMVLLGQANLTVAGFENKQGLSYEEYEKELTQAHNWFIYQQTLLDVLYKISELKYALHLGQMSKEESVSFITTYEKQTADSLERLRSWNNTMIEAHKIDLDEKRREATGIDGVFWGALSVFNKDWSYYKMDESTLDMIQMQSSDQYMAHRPSIGGGYEEDVQIIAKDGKLYYLQSSDSE